MKIIWLINPYGPIEGENWREYSFNQFGKFLSQAGYEVVWWTANFSHHFKKYRSEGWKDLRINDNYIIRLVPTSSYKKNIGFGRQRKDYLFGKNFLKEVNKYDVPDLILAAENPMTMGKPAFFYANKHNVPIIYDQMDVWPEFLIKVLPFPVSSVVNFIMKPVYKRRKKIYKHLSGSVALGKNYLEFMFGVSPELRNKPHALVYNGIDVDEFRKNLNNRCKDDFLKKNKDEIWCIFAGTLGPSYDIKTVIDCAKELYRCENNKYKFLIAGSGPLEIDVRNAQRDYKNIIYVGKLKPDELIPIYGMCDIGLCSYSAGSNVDMPDKIYDYTAAGLAVVNSLGGEVRDYVSEYEIGCNYISGDYKSLAKSIEKICKNGKISMFKENSFNLGMNFDKNVQNKKLLEVVEKLI